MVQAYPNPPVISYILYSGIYLKITFFLVFHFVLLNNVKCPPPRHHGMARPQVADGEEDLQVWRVPLNILNKQSQISDKG
jgi:hypothetical protein